MKKLITLSTFLFTISCAWSQKLLESNPDLHYMIESERAFAKKAKNENTRDAFLYYMDDSVITAGPKGPIIGKAEIEKQKVGNGWLKWDVAFADIDARGDFGYTTGPWEFRANKADETPVAYGEFNSIWKKNEDGTWKNVCDIGVSHRKGTTVDSIELKVPATQSHFSMVKFRKKDLLYLERLFIDELKKDKKSAYKNTMADESRIIHQGNQPIITSEQKEKYFENIENISEVTVIDGFLPRSGEIGYVYGKATVQVNTKGTVEDKTATYLRVWKMDHSKWKIVLDVLSYK